jgi:hypothetical protein
MTILVFCLVSILCSFFWIETISNKIKATLSYIPFITFLFIKSEFLTIDLLSILIPTFVSIFVCIAKNKTISNGLKKVLIFLPWIMLVFYNMGTLIELTIFLVGINFLNFSIGSEDTFNDKKLIQYESSNMLSICLFGFLLILFTVFIYGDIEINHSPSAVSAGKFYQTYQYLLLIFVFYILGAYGSFSKIENILVNIKRKNIEIYSFIKLVFIPLIVFPSLKQIFDANLIVQQEYMLSIILITFLYVFIQDLKRTNFDIKAYSIAVFHLLNIGLIYLFIGDFSLTIFSTLLFVNYLSFLVITMDSVKDQYRYFFKMVYLAAPFTPVFCAKVYFYQEATSNMSPILIFIFTLFLFLPLLFTHRLEKVDR